MEIGGRDHAAATVRIRHQGSDPLPQVPGEITAENGVINIATATPTAVVRILTEWSAERGEAELPGLAVTRPSLEDVYLDMVRAADGRTQ